MGPSGGALAGSWGFLVRSQVLLGGLLGGLGGFLGSSMGDPGELLGPHGSLHCGCLQVRSKKKGFMKMCSWLERGQDFGGLGGFLAGSWGSLVASWGPLGTSWGPLGVVLGGSWLLLAPLGAFLRASWLTSSECKRYTSLSWRDKAPKGPHRAHQREANTLIRTPPVQRNWGWRPQNVFWLQ